MRSFAFSLALILQSTLINYAMFLAPPPPLEALLTSRPRLTAYVDPAIVSAIKATIRPLEAMGTYIEASIAREVRRRLRTGPRPVRLSPRKRCAA